MDLAVMLGLQVLLLTSTGFFFPEYRRGRTSGVHFQIINRKIPSIITTQTSAKKFSETCRKFSNILRCGTMFLRFTYYFR